MTLAGAAEAPRLLRERAGDVACGLADGNDVFIVLTDLA